MLTGLLAKQIFAQTGSESATLVCRQCESIVNCNITTVSVWFPVEVVVSYGNQIVSIVKENRRSIR